MLYKTLVVFTLHIFGTICCSRSRLSLWIDEKQVNSIVAGVKMIIYIVSDGKVVPYINHPDFDHFVISPEVNTVNLTWEAGHETFTYWFDELRTLDETLLYTPLLSIPASGVIPERPSIFQISIPCTGKENGISKLSLGLQIFNNKGRPIKGSPMKLALKKKCEAFVPSKHCQFNCLHGGFCNHLGDCECTQGFQGKRCEASFCNPICENNGTCMSPDVCICPDGFSGKRCEEALCQNSCRNGGRCIQENVCWCTKGYLGNACQYSRCRPDCKNGGICVGHHKCQCPLAYTGDICETENKSGRPRRSHFRKRRKQKKKTKNGSRKQIRNKNTKKKKLRKDKKKRSGRRSLLKEVERFSRRQRKRREKELRTQLDKIKTNDKRRKRRKLYVR